MSTIEIILVWTGCGTISASLLIWLNERFYPFEVLMTIISGPLFLFVFFLFGTIKFIVECLDD